jgi:hypothetical protein
LFLPQPSPSLLPVSQNASSFVLSTTRLDVSAALLTNKLMPVQGHSRQTAQGILTEGGWLSTIDLLVLTSLDQLHLYLKYYLLRLQNKLP